MHHELYQRLKEIDRRGFEHGIDYRWRWEEIVAHKPTLEHLLGFSLQTGHDEDTGTIGYLCHLEPRSSNESGTGDFKMTSVISFSEFDRLFTIEGVSRPHSHQIAQVIEYLTLAGFNYVSSVDLATPYDGEAENHRTWFDRFFSYQ